MATRTYVYTPAIVRAYALARLAEVYAPYDAAQAKADAAWDRWFEKRMAGEPTNGAAAMRLANYANFLSADCYHAAGQAYSAGASLAEVQAVAGGPWLGYA